MEDRCNLRKQLSQFVCFNEGDGGAQPALLMKADSQGRGSGLSWHRLLTHILPVEGQAIGEGHKDQPSFSLGPLLFFLSICLLSSTFVSSKSFTVSSTSLSVQSFPCYSVCVVVLVFFGGKERNRTKDQL